MKRFEFKSSVCHLGVILIIYYFNNNGLERDE